MFPDENRAWPSVILASGSLGFPESGYRRTFLTAKNSEGAMRVQPSPEELTITRAVMDVMRHFPGAKVLEFVSEHPEARVRDFSNAFLDGLVLESKGPTSRGYEAVARRLRWARRELELPLLTGRGGRLPTAHAPADL